MRQLVEVHFYDGAHVQQELIDASEFATYLLERPEVLWVKVTKRAS
jgi:hypothetical protein